MAPSPKAADAWQWVSLISPVVALAANALAQLILFRVRKGAQFFRSIAEGAVCGAMVGAAITMVLIIKRDVAAGSLLIPFVTNGLSYLALSYCYYHFVQLGQTSIRIRIYTEIVASGCGLTVEEIAGRYNDSALMRLRLQRLLESGDLVERNRRYFVGRWRFVYISRILFRAKRLILGGKGKFDDKFSPSVTQ